MIPRVFFFADSPDKAIDNALRKVYSDTRHALRREGIELMAIEFTFKGTRWRVDTPEEAVKLRNELEASDRVYSPAIEKAERVDAFWTADRFNDVVSGAGELQHRFLIAIRRKPGITSKELLAELGLDSEIALAGVISGLTRQLRQMEIEPRSVFGVDVIWHGKKKTRKFSLDDFFLAAGEDQGWPDAWGGNLKDTKGTKRAVKKSRATKTTKAGE